MWYNTTLAAKKLNVSRRTIYNLIDRGYLITKKGSGGIMVFLPVNVVLNKKNKRHFRLSYLMDK